MVNSEEKYSYFWLEFYATAFLVIIPVILFWDQFPGYNAYLVLGCFLGFCFGGFFKERPFQSLKLLINTSAFFILAWLIYSIANSSFFYRDIILICAQGLIFLEIILSFGAAASPNFLSYLQALTLPLFISWPVLAREYSLLSSVLMPAYIVFLFVVFILKFRGLFSARERPKFSLSGLCLPAGVLLAGAFISWMASGSIVFEGIPKGGVLSESDIESEFEQKGVESQYYDAQNKFQNELMPLIPRLENTEDRHKLLMLLNNLIKDSPSVAEVKRASQGLVDFFRRPGPGLEKGDSEGLTILLKGYLKQKAAFHLRKAKNNIMDTLRNNSFNIAEKAGILTRANNIQHSDSYEKVFRNKEELDAIAGRSIISQRTKQELNSQVKDLTEWKSFELGVRSDASVNDSPKENSLPVEPEEDSLNQPEGGFEPIPDIPVLAEIEGPKLISIIISPQDARITMYGNVPFKAKGYFDDYSQEEITSKVDWKIDNPAAVKIDRAVVYPLKAGSKTFVYAQYSGIKSSPANIAVIFTKWQIFLIIAKLMALVFVCALIMFIVLYFLALEERSKLRSSIASNPKQFMVNLYDNARSLLCILGAVPQTVMPPLLYADLVEKKYSIEGNLFLKWTMKAAEAKYSGHLLQSNDASAFLDNYNSLLKIFLGRQAKTELFFKYCLALWKRKPLFLEDCKLKCDKRS